jgi:hypothetical protein
MQWRHPVRITKFCAGAQGDTVCVAESWPASSWREETIMMRTGLLVLLLAACALAAPAARAQNMQPENEDARFTFHRADEGYLRLDGRSGQVSVCNRRPAGWLCQAVPDERVALEGEIARLQADNAALKKELVAHDLPLPGGIKPEPAAKPDEPRLQLPNDAEFNQVMGFIEKVWRRLAEMITNVQRDLMKKS